MVKIMYTEYFFRSPESMIEEMILDKIIKIFYSVHTKFKKAIKCDLIYEHHRKPNVEPYTEYDHDKIFGRVFKI
jgi:hypothetical protein